MIPSKINWKHLLISILLCQFTGLLGALFTTPAIPTWYATLMKPSFVPPSWTFSVVWTLLYMLMSIALYLVWEKGLEKADVKKAMGVFGIQLFLNFMWSVLFFGLRSPLYGLDGIVVLWVAILVNIWLFYRISKPAALLLVPYILWASFAAVLNYSIWVLNG
ncbi:TspO/MBR family protein [uncultured Methanomethylovorans sp.]|uniref:TspO/MBR family protein n=1 Tax=uncultured Methanomethylovorans sp. TaxID=183759 RepID=UPI002AA7E78B|nr:TspO/MBR family protein [uncultured Methanomethylovorans sp.]